MDNRRGYRAVPKVRQVGFFTPNEPPAPSRTQSGPPDATSPPLSNSPASNSLSPVMIPPPRHLSDNLAHRATSPLPVPESSAFRRPMTGGEHVPVIGSYNPTESLLVVSPPLTSPSSRVDGGGDGDGELFSEESSPGWFRRSNSAKFAASSFPGGGFDLTSIKSSEVVDAKKKPVVEKSGGADGTVLQNELALSSSKPLKAKTTKAERRALQESQRAAKAASKGEATGKPSTISEGASKPAKQQPPQKKDAPPSAPSIAASERKGVDRPSEKERKKDVPQPRMQFDDKNRVEKAKRRAVVNQTEARNRVELFRHLPQYEHGTQLPDLESKFFQLDLMHPAVCKVGLQYLAGDISGGNARCIAMLLAFQEAIKDYSTPPEKSLTRDLTAKINSYVSFLIECRPLSMSMGNAIRFLKSRIANFPITFAESEAKASLCSDIDRFINEKILLADKVIVRHAASKVRDGDVLLTYGSSCVVEMILLYAHELGKQFRVVIVDARPMLEGQALLRRLVAKGLSCTYTHINAVSYIMHEVTRVFLGASSVLSNGTVYSRVGTACVAMVAHAFHVPVLVCCEAYKFHERVQLDSICSNELGSPNAIAKVPGRRDLNCLDNLANKENLQLLNLMYDATPSEYVSMIVTDYGMIPPTSVPVIVREYRREHLWI
ncbi:translation initiation factor eIF-2B subunit delta isoform X1 [Ricinus communis]|uniref:translation initiation factor eIF-2B subunit delta isoform X1 n=2 Tax=Ricinus communis TaxID=3988 RepID=UPI00201A7D8A|nr:translation initiation factor eIF-2B subunit delta isoform X1 [Ricinus communis]